jgi:hypothetical protein
MAGEVCARTNKAGQAMIILSFLVASALCMCRNDLLNTRKPIYERVTRCLTCSRS